MELRLMLDAHGWRADERRLADEADVEAKALGKRHFIADSLMVVCERLFVSVDIGVKKSWNPRKVAVDVEPLDELIDLIDGRPPGIPHGLRVVLSQRRRQVGQARVDHRREMRSRAASVDAPDAAALDQSNAAPGFLQQKSCGDASEAAADDHCVDVERVAQRWKPWQVNLVPPGNGSKVLHMSISLLRGGGRIAQRGGAAPATGRDNPQ